MRSHETIIEYKVLLTVTSFVFQLLLEHAEAIAPDPNDALHAILKDLGSTPSIENLLGEHNILI